MPFTAEKTPKRTNTAGRIQAETFPMTLSSPAIALVFPRALYANQRRMRGRMYTRLYTAVSRTTTAACGDSAAIAPKKPK